MSTDLVNYSIPGEPGIVNDNMDLAAAELRGALHEFIDIVGIRDITDYSESSAGFDRIDSISYSVGLFC